ncbi:glycosyltransferase [Chlamydiota bacterium]
MNIIYCERSLEKYSTVFDQISRISKYTKISVISPTTSFCNKIEDERVHYINVPFFPKIECIKGYLFKHKACKIIKQLPKDLAPDLIHSHFAYPDGLGALEISRILKIPYIITLRGDDILIYPERNNYLRKKIKEILKNASGILGVSNNICSKAIELGADPKVFYHIPDGIDETIFFPIGEKNSSNSPSILFAGSLLPVKNPVKMLKSFSLVLKKCPEATFSLAGEGFLEKKLRILSKKLQIEPKCIFLGQLSAENLADKMRKASLLCLPSLSEGWGNVITESMACGTPVVAANVGGIPEQIISDDYGLLCNPLSVEDIASKIIDALQKKWDYAKIEKRGLIYTRDTTAKQIYEIYKKTVK